MVLGKHQLYPHCLLLCPFGLGTGTAGISLSTPGLGNHTSLRTLQASVTWHSHCRCRVCSWTLEARPPPLVPDVAAALLVIFFLLSFFLLLTGGSFFQGEVKSLVRNVEGTPSATILRLCLGRVVWGGWVGTEPHVGENWKWGTAGSAG